MHCSPIAIAKQQNARRLSCAQLSNFARLDNTMGRSADPHAFLAPALRGPDPGIPELAEAPTLLAALTS
jgi:hypothetical protein